MSGAGLPTAEVTGMLERLTTAAAEGHLTLERLERPLGRSRQRLDRTGYRIMSKRHELYGRIRALTDIKGILNALKNLALMEVHKLDRFLSAQQRVVAGIEEVATDIFSFYPTLLPPTADAHPVFLLIGSERGFCGDFNESLLAEFDRCRSEGSVERVSRHRCWLRSAISWP
jgi:hypothetical protein